MSALARWIPMEMASSTRKKQARWRSVGGGREALAVRACAVPMAALEVLLVKAAVSVVRLVAAKVVPQEDLLAASPKAKACAVREKAVVDAACLVTPRKPSNAWMPMATAASPRRNTPSLPRKCARCSVAVRVALA